MNAAWLTDIHLNFLDKATRIKYYQEIINLKCDALFISGDIAEASDLSDSLIEMAEHIKKPIYFILGNHDYYRGQITEVRESMTSLTKENQHLFWLPAAGIQKLNANTLLLGQDGWADGRLGNSNSNVSINDSLLIADLFQKKLLSKSHLLEKMRELADMDAMQLQNDLHQAISQSPENIIVLTHVPPFKETSLYEGKVSNDDWLPYFTSKVLGDVLMKVAQENSSINFLVLCGHTHSKAEYQPLDNLLVKVGKAEYNKPEIQEVFAL